MQKSGENYDLFCNANRKEIKFHLECQYQGSWIYPRRKAVCFK